MRSITKLGAVFLLVAAVLCGSGLSPAQATPITYTFTGTGSGDLAGNSFFDVFFKVAIPGDTANVETTTYGPDTPTITGLTGTIALTGVGTGTFSNPLYVFNNQTNEAVGFGDFINFDLIDLFVPGKGLATYDLRTSFGPITDPNPYFSQFTSVGLSIGTLSFSGVSNATFTAEVVPLPGTLLLLGSGLTGLLGWRRFRKV
jgi:hypothetical protein